MNCCDNSKPEAICPCGEFVHPRVIFNAPGRDALSYRAGDYATFRRALLQSRPGETELTREGQGQIWRPTGEGDLALQMMEWWAYVADILTFYNERIANQDYLRTADIPENVNRLIRLLGYRPRPGIGATGVLAALANGPKPFVLPKGFQIQSKPGPGKQPQIFELDVNTTVGGNISAQATSPPGPVPAELTPGPNQRVVINNSDGGLSIFLAGTSSAVRKGDTILIQLQPKFSTDSQPPFAITTVSGVVHQKDSSGKPITEVQVPGIDNSAQITDITHYELFTGSQAAHLYQYATHSSDVIGSNFAHLDSIYRQIKVDDWVFFQSGGNTKKFRVIGYTEKIYYANNPDAPGTDPSTTSPPGHAGTAILHSLLTVDDTDDSLDSGMSTLMRFGWRQVGLLNPVPSRFLPTPSGAGAAANAAVPLQPAGDLSFPQVSESIPVLIEDATGNGARGTLGPGQTLTVDNPVPALNPPLQVLFNLLHVSRGKSVKNEVLGNGNAAIPGQEFILQNAPVTYLQGDSNAGDDYSSTIEIWVNDVKWSEAPSFYGQASDAKIFVTREDEQGKTHVVFGDGENGLRLPTGVNNVLANYRYGSGAEAPDAGSLTVILQPQPGLKAIRNPVAVGGGSDPDAADKVRRLAPKSVLTFNRAVSAEDYEVIAAQAPGVVRARAVYEFDADEQRPVVKIRVGDNQAAVDAAKQALADSDDPNRPAVIEAAKKIEVTLSLTLVIDPTRKIEIVRQAVHDALVDSDHGLLGINIVEIGQPIYDSQVFAACAAVPGVVAIHDLTFVSTAAKSQVGSKSSICNCDHRHDPGDDSYFFLPDDSQHLVIMPT
jgi:hypothetical protein